MILIPILLAALGASIWHRNHKDRDAKAVKDADIIWTRYRADQERNDHAGHD